MHNQTCSQTLGLLQKTLVYLSQFHGGSFGIDTSNTFNEILHSARQLFLELTEEERQDILFNFLAALPWKLVKEENGVSHKAYLDVGQPQRSTVEIMFSVIQLRLDDSFTTQVKLSQNSIVKIEVDYDADGHLTLPEGAISIDGKPSLNYHSSCLVTLTMGQAHPKRSIADVKAAIDPAYSNGDYADTSDEQPLVGSNNHGNDFEF